MAIIAILTGGLMGSVTALIALFGIGVDWSTGATIYFATATIFALPMIGVNMVNNSKKKPAPNMSDWELALNDGQKKFESPQQKSIEDQTKKPKRSAA